MLSSLVFSSLSLSISYHCFLRLCLKCWRQSISQASLLLLCQSTTLVRPRHWSMRIRPLVMDLSVCSWPRKTHLYYHWHSNLLPSQHSVARTTFWNIHLAGSGFLLVLDDVGRADRTQHGLGQFQPCRKRSWRHSPQRSLSLSSSSSSRSIAKLQVNRQKLCGENLHFRPFFYYTVQYMQFGLYKTLQYRTGWRCSKWVTAFAEVNDGPSLYEHTARLSIKTWRFFVV
jgi:hypothetical protein